MHETTNAYIIEGELPGVPDKSDISVEFTDKGNLIVKGRVDRSRTAAVPLAQPQTPPSLPSQETSNKGKGKEDKDEEMTLTPTSSAPSSPQSLKPTVEDVPDEDDWMGIVEASTEKSRPEGEAARVEKPAEKKEQPRRKVTKREEWPKRLLSERSVGEFVRSFSFPAGIDHDAVTASLQHGVLRIVVPKRISGVGKRIEVQ